MEHVEIIQILLHLFRDLTCRNSDADTTNLEKSIIQNYLQCKVVIMVVIKKTEMEHKEIDYKGVKRCLFPTNSRCWRPTKIKYLERRPYHTRQRAKLPKRVNEELKYNVDKAIYDTLQKVHGDNFSISADFKIIFIKDVQFIVICFVVKFVMTIDRKIFYTN